MEAVSTFRIEEEGRVLLYKERPEDGRPHVQLVARSLATTLAGLAPLCDFTSTTRVPEVGWEASWYSCTIMPEMMPGLWAFLHTRSVHHENYAKLERFCNYHSMRRPLIRYIHSWSVSFGTSCPASALE